MAKKRKPASSSKKESSSEEEQEQQLEQEEDSEKSESPAESSEEEEDNDEEDEEDEEDDDDEEKAKDSSASSEDEEEEDQVSKRETIRKLLEPFGKDQLIELVKQAAVEDPSIISRISRSADSDPVHRKIFVHGLAWDATSQTLISAFENYGPIEECNVITDKVTGKSKGYGFVLFATRAGARQALKQPQKKIGNRTASCQLASAGPIPNHPGSEITGRKIFVSNIGSNINPEKLKAFFSKFGEIEEGPLGYDRITGKLKGFALFVFKTPEGCRKALEEPSKLLEGCQLHCQRAVDGLRAQTKLVGPVGSAAVLQPNDLALAYASSASLMGLNPGIVGQNLNPATALMGQNPAFNPSLLTQPSANQSALTPPSSFGLGGLGGGFGGQSGINSISPSVIGSYGSQAALQGLGAYQSPQLGQSPSSASAATRTASGIGSFGGFSSYLGR